MIGRFLKKSTENQLKSIYTSKILKFYYIITLILLPNNLRPVQVSKNYIQS